MASSTPSDDGIISGINVTPLVDVVLVILIIFIMTASLIFKSGVDLELPRARSAEDTTAGLLNVAIDREGKLYVNGKPSALAALTDEVAAARRRLATRQDTVKAFVSADVKAQYGAFARVVDLLRVEGVTEIALDTQPVHGEEQAR